MRTRGRQPAGVEEPVMAVILFAFSPAAQARSPRREAGHALSLVLEGWT